MKGICIVLVYYIYLEKLGIESLCCFNFNYLKIKV